MRILQIRFKNLNSLVGEWCLNLDNPAFTAEGLFAITGPTGAGKSTLLDALCLALYGRTPRLDKISKDHNEIMSRQTGECFAEVIFATPNGQYRCHWSQHRARRRADGALQQARHEVAHASGQLIESKLSLTQPRIEQLTGMSFANFTRAMLLAQGQFAAFLQAGAAERAPILEQITGTDIYSTLSKKVHERLREEQQHQQQLEVALGGLHPSDPETVAQLEAELQQLQAQSTQLKQHQDQQRQALHWLEHCQQHQAQLIQLKQQQQDLHQRQQQFAPQQRQLEQARKARVLAPDYRQLQGLRTALKQTEEQLQQLQIQQTTARQQLESDDQQWQAAHQQALQCEAQLNRQLPQLEQVRGLDRQLHEQQQTLDRLSKKRETLYRQLQQQQTNQNQYQHRQQQLQQQRDQLQQQLESSPQTDQLCQRQAALMERLQRLQALDRQHQQAQQQWNKLDHQLRALTQQSQRAQQRDAELTRIHTQLQQQVISLQQQRQQCLQGQSLSHWHQQLSQLQQRQQDIQQLEQWQQQYPLREQERLNLEQQGHQLKTQLEQCSQQVDQQRQLCTAREQAVQLALEQSRLVQKIADLEQERQQLQNGEPCPLCGALEHPFVSPTARPQTNDATRQHLQQLQEALNQSREALGHSQRKQAQLEQALQHQQLRLQEQLERCQQLAHELQERRQQLGLQTADDLPALLRQLSPQQAECAQRLKEAEQLEQQLQSQQMALQRLQAEQTQHQQQHQQEREQLLQLQTHHGAQQQRCQQLAEEVKSLLQQLDSELAPFQLPPLQLSQLTCLQEAIAQQVETRNQQQQLYRQLQDSYRELEHQLHLEERTLQQTQQTLAELEQQYQNAQLQWERHHRDRQTLLGNDDPDQQALRLQQSLQQARQQLAQREQQLQLSRQALIQLEAQYQQRQEQQQQLQPQLQQQQADWQGILQHSCFADEAAYLAAYLPNEQQQALEHQAQQLAQEQTYLSAHQQQTQEALAQLQQQALTTDSWEQLMDSLQGLEHQQQQLQQQLGAHRQQLLQQQQLRQQQAKHLAALEAQQRECQRWQRLHSLIGSADGQKYRNFAQGLTFELVVAQANQQLQQMSDRYLLLRSLERDAPLELLVVDGYQAGEVRSTKNLSGGESFIISLALALGLSRMASHQVRVDSLFLDEGFGTLDEEALETALNALASLQQDGKLIGVISHVEALKSRIATQIRVRPLSGGRSTLEGPGCQRLD